MQAIEKSCELGRNVIAIEAEVIQSLATRLDQSFVKACEAILACKGRVIVMGMGKSGHISKKMAATFASTGTPAFYIHPAEAKHGDFGMITSQDVVIAVSYSGETEEILAILPFIKNLNIPLIALTAKSDSTLGSAATIFIDVSVNKEACPLGLAPTSSTTAALVMGDALAITLLQIRGFTKEDFARSHPGGALGRRLLLKVDDIMHVNDAIPKVTKNAFLKTALMEITQKKLGLTTVVHEDNTLAGVFTDGDVRRAFDNNANVHSTRIHEIMTFKPRVIPPGTLASKALDMMRDHQITALIITNEVEHPVGVIHIQDILRAGII